MTPVATGRSRLRFASLQRSPQPDGHCHVAVELEWAEEIQRSEADGFDTQQGLINAAAEATLSAIHTVAGEVRLSVVGVKAVRAFDGWVVVTRLSGTRGDVTHRLLGAAPCEAEEDLPNATVMAILDASNRMVELALGAPTGAVD